MFKINKRHSVAYCGQCMEIWLLYPKAKYSYQYEGIRDRFETKIYGHTLVIHLFFIDLENMEESMKRLSQGLEDKMAGEVKKYE